MITRTPRASVSMTDQIVVERSYIATNGSRITMLGACWVVLVTGGIAKQIVSHDVTLDSYRLAVARR